MGAPMAVAGLGGPFMAPFPFAGMQWPADAEQLARMQGKRWQGRESLSSLYRAFRDKEQGKAVDQGQGRLENAQVYGVAALCIASGCRVRCHTSGIGKHLPIKPLGRSPRITFSFAYPSLLAQPFMPQPACADNAGMGNLMTALGHQQDAARRAAEARRA